MSLTIEQAITIAIDAHMDQVDKAGKPYILHPLRVGARLAEFGSDAMIAGILHDVVEDSEWTLDDLRAAGANETILNAVDSVTKIGTERTIDAYVTSVQRALADPVGRLVKAADIADNYGRVGGLPDGPAKARLVAKYEAVLPIVRATVPEFAM